MEFVNKAGIVFFITVVVLMIFATVLQAVQL